MLNDVDYGSPEIVETHVKLAANLAECKARGVGVAPFSAIPPGSDDGSVVLDTGVAISCCPSTGREGIISDGRVCRLVLRCFRKLQAASFGPVFRVNYQIINNKLWVTEVTNVPVSPIVCARVLWRFYNSTVIYFDREELLVGLDAGLFLGHGASDLPPGMASTVMKRVSALLGKQIFKEKSALLGEEVGRRKAKLVYSCLTSACSVHAKEFEGAHGIEASYSGPDCRTAGSEFLTEEEFFIKVFETAGSLPVNISLAWPLCTYRTQLNVLFKAKSAVPGVDLGITLCEHNNAEELKEAALLVREAAGEFERGKDYRLGMTACTPASLIGIRDTAPLLDYIRIDTGMLDRLVTGLPPGTPCLAQPTADLMCTSIASARSVNKNIVIGVSGSLSSAAGSISLFFKFLRGGDFISCESYYIDFVKVYWAQRRYRGKRIVKEAHDNV